MRDDEVYKIRLAYLHIRAVVPGGVFLTVTVFFWEKNSIIVAKFFGHFRIIKRLLQCMSYVKIIFDFTNQ